jgi:hypothetical protein
MALRFQLINEIVGSVILERADPIGINSLTQNVKRSPTNDGVMYEIVLDLDFIKDGRKFMKEAYEQGGGIDAQVDVNIFDWEPNLRKWELYFTGRVNMAKWSLHEEKVEIGLEQTGLERRVLNLLDIDVDLETLTSENGSALPAANVISAMAYHSKKIQKETIALPGDEYLEHQQLDVYVVNDLPGEQTTYRERVIYGNMATEKKTRNELLESFGLPFGWSDFGLGLGLTGPASVAQTKAFLEVQPTPRFPIQTMEEAGLLDVNIALRLLHEIEATDASGDVDVCGDGALGNIEIHAWFEVRDDEDNIVVLEHVGEFTMPQCGDPGNTGNESTGVMETKSYSQTGIAVGIGYKVYVYETIRIYADYDNTGIGDEDVSHHFRVTPAEGYSISLLSATEAPASTAKTILLHEAFQRCCQYYTNQIDCFRSDLLGRPEITFPGPVTPYTEDGQGALIGLTNGNNLRGRPRQIFANLQDLIEFTDSLFCTAFGFETIDGKQVLRLEKRSHFYRKDERILSLGEVPSIVRKVAAKKFYNSVEMGYAEKIDIKQINAIDEFNTVRRWGIPIVNTKQTLKMSTKMITGGYPIEAQRRLSTSTEDGKHDDRNFAVVTIRDGLTFKTKKNEGYSAITGVFDPASIYNVDISPARNLLNWLQVLASGVIRSTNKVLRFTFGEVNFTMTSQKTTEASPVAENGNVDLTGIEPIWDNEMYIFKCPLSRNQMKLIKANPYGYIEFNDRFGETFEGFIDNFEHEPNEGKATFELLKVHRP